VRGIEKKTSALLDTTFVKAHFGGLSIACAAVAVAAPPAAAAAGASSAPLSDTDGDATMSAAAERSDANDGVEGARGFERKRPLC
jgi:hypothetical protein